MRMPAIDGVARKYLRLFGMALGLGAIVFVAQRLLAYRGEIDWSAIGPVGYGALAALCVLYAASNLALAEGWRSILMRLGVRVPFRQTTSIYALSQLAKYVPGNIFHLVGRQALGAAAGVPHAALAKSALLELVVIAVCTALFAPLVLPLVFSVAWTSSSLVLFALGTCVSAATAWRLFGPLLLRSAAFYAVYLATSGAIFTGVFVLTSGGVAWADLPSIAGAYVLAWLAGLVTPGAPAGLGVREAVLVFLLGGLAAPPVILLAVVTGRAVTVLGDLAFYVVGVFLSER